METTEKNITFEFGKSSFGGNDIVTFFTPKGQIIGSYFLETIIETNRQILLDFGYVCDMDMLNKVKAEYAKQIKITKEDVVISKRKKSKALDIFEQCDPIFKEMISAPIGHNFSWDIERQNTWFLNAPGDSLSAYIEREPKYDDDPKQYYAEFRIFIESERPSGLLFIDYGARYAGKNKPLIQNHKKIEAESYVDLAHKLSNIFNDILKEHIV